jgi:hypothetical protein
MSSRRDFVFKGVGSILSRILQLKDEFFFFKKDRSLVHSKKGIDIVPIPKELHNSCIIPRNLAEITENGQKYYVDLEKMIFYKE